MSKLTHSNEIRDKIVVTVLRTLPPILIVFLISDSVVVLFNPRQWIGLFPNIISIAVLVVVLWTVRIGKLRLAANLFTTMAVATVVTGMVLNGGVLAPSYIASLVVVGLTAWIYGPRVSILFSVGFVVVGGIFVWLHAQGLLRESTPMPPLYFWLLFSGYYILAWGATATPNRMLRDTLAESEERRAAAEEAYLREQRALHDLTLGEAERERLISAIEQLDEMVIITGTDGAIQYVNPSFTEVTGYTSDDVLGQNPRILKSGQHDDAFYRDMWETLLRGETWRGRLVNRKKDGTLYTEESAISPIKDSSGKVVSFVAVRHDITRELVLESQYRQAQKMESVGRLAGGVAHDMNNMLAVISGYSELTLARLQPSDPSFEYLQEIQTAAKHSAGLVQQLMAFARKQIVQPKVLDLNREIERILKMMQRLIGENIRLVWKPSSTVWSISIDPSQIDQILANLCVNARDAIDDVGTLSIETRNVVVDKHYCSDHSDCIPGEYVLLSVSDSGCGMDQSTLDQIFEPFFTTKDLGKGTGLGLATIYGIVKQNDGFIGVYSEVGRGTTFKIHLPRHMDNAAPTQESETEPVILSGHETVLLVEDELAILRIIKVTLEELGYTVLAAPAPAVALRLAEENAGKIHLLITDVIMPEMNGQDLANRLQQICPGMKRLYMSGYTAEHISRHGVLDARVCFLNKPFSKRELAAKVREALLRG